VVDFILNLLKSLCCHEQRLFCAEVKTCPYNSNSVCEAETFFQMRDFLLERWRMTRVWLQKWKPQKQSLLSAGHDNEPVVLGKYYSRTGSCNGCGQCCHHIYLIVNKQVLANEAMFREARERFPEYEAFEPIEQTDTGLLFRCRNLLPDNRCGIYESRPDFCRSYPQEENILKGGNLHSDCSYVFTLRKTFDKVLQEASGQQQSA
jgi:uncharacterized protein